MIIDETGATIEAHYVGGERLAERAPATTLGTFVGVVSDEAAAPPTKRSRPTHGTTASSLQDYSESVAAKPSGAVLAFRDIDGKPAGRPLSPRNAAAIALLEKWLADDSGYDEDTWPALKAGIEESRTSTRKRFRD